MKVQTYLEGLKVVIDFAEKYKFPTTHINTILYLGRKGFDKDSGGTCIGNVGLETKVSASGVSSCLTDLMKKGMIEKRIDPKNQRTRYVSLTEKGTKLYKEIKTEIDKIETLF